MRRLRRKPKPQKPEKPKPVYDPNFGSGWYPGVSDGSHLLPDWVGELKRTNYHGVFRRGGSG